MEADTVLSPQELRALWQQLGDDASLVEPYELTEHGEVVMSPRATTRHRIASSMIVVQLHQQLGPLAVTEAAVLTTTAGVRVPDVLWMPAHRWAGIVAGSEPLVEAPELVVEVLSPAIARSRSYTRYAPTWPRACAKSSSWRCTARWPSTVKTVFTSSPRSA